MQITPTVNATTAQELEEQMILLCRLTDRIQIDVADGILINHKTIPLTHFAAFCEKHEGQFAGNIFDFHLMVSEWEDVVSDLNELRSIIHINLILVHQVVFRRNTSNFFPVGLVLNPEDTVSRETFKHVPAVQIMTVNPGPQGSPFLPQNLSKISDLRNSGYKGEILLDGGINEVTIPTILKQSVLPDVLGIGSQLTKSPSPQEEFKQLTDLIRKY
ncbi:MAG: hypothetical protein WC775_03765 [Patescibacteria group bacterium]|jgi:pentose-5-phosphate-3-epimerase